MSKEVMTERVTGQANVKYLLWLGLIAPLFIVAMVLVAAAITPDYSHLYRAVSTLGMDEMRHRALFNVSMIVYGFMVIAYVYGVYDLLGRNRAAKAIAILFIVHAVGIMFAGIFNDEILDAGETISAEAIAHSTLAIAAYFALVVLMCVFSLLVRHNLAWKGLGWFTALVIVVSMPLLGLFIYKEGTYLGLFQRIGYGVMLFWVFVFTIKLLWLSRGSSHVSIV